MARGTSQHGGKSGRLGIELHVRAAQTSRTGGRDTVRLGGLVEFMAGRDTRVNRERTMKIDTRQVYDVIVVDMTGRLDTQTSGYAYDEMVRIAKGDAG